MILKTAAVLFSLGMMVPPLPFQTYGRAPRWTRSAPVRSCCSPADYGQYSSPSVYQSAPAANRPTPAAVAKKVPMETITPPASDYSPRLKPSDGY